MMADAQLMQEQIVRRRMRDRKWEIECKLLDFSQQAAQLLEVIQEIETEVLNTLFLHFWP